MKIWGINAILIMLMTLMGQPAAKAQDSNVAYKDNQVRFTVISDGTVPPTVSLPTTSRLWQ